MLPLLLQDTNKVLDMASQNHTVVNMQEIFLELTTRLMGTVAYDVRLAPLACGGLDVDC